MINKKVQDKIAVLREIECINCEAEFPTLYRICRVQENDVYVCINLANFLDT